MLNGCHGLATLTYRATRSPCACHLSATTLSEFETCYCSYVGGMVCLLGFKRDWIAASKRVLKEARLLLAIACSTKAADYNVINLDNNTLKMVTGKDIPVFVRFDKDYPYGEKASALRSLRAQSLV